MSKQGVVHTITEKALELLASKPGGIRVSDLVQLILENDDSLNENSVGTIVGMLPKQHPEKVLRPSRGLLQLRGITASSKNIAAAQTPPANGSKLREDDFYGTFAQWLQDRGDATNATPLGGAGLKDKWGTPDVVGVYKKLPSDRVTFPTEIISAEIKIDPYQSITAFGQAAAYRLFSHTSMLVMPKSTPQDDLSRLESLCVLFGIGLVTFNLDKDSPHYTLDVRAQRFTPDWYYVNQFADGLHHIDSKAFNVLF